MPKPKQFLDLHVGLNLNDRVRLAEIAQLEGKTKTEIARDAIRWHLDHYEERKNAAREGQIAEAIRYATEQLIKAIHQGVDRICKMLNRQGLSIETLFELTYASLPDDENAVAAFAAAANRAKDKMRRRVQKDEQDIADRSKKIVVGEHS